LQLWYVHDERICGASCGNVKVVRGGRGNPPSRRDVLVRMSNSQARCFIPSSQPFGRHTPRMRGIQYAAPSRFHVGVSAPDFAEPVIGRRSAPTRWLHPGYGFNFETATRSQQRVRSRAKARLSHEVSALQRY
jgi:hypothetical protein